MRRNINLRQQITLQTPAATVDSFGQHTRTWTTFATVWADIAPVGARELQAGDAANLQVTHRITIRWLSDLTSDKRVLFGSRVFQIVGIRNIEERNEYLELLALEGTANA